MTDPAILCPHCGSAAVVPLPALGDKLSSVFSLTWRRPGKDLSFNNPELAAQFHQAVPKAASPSPGAAPPRPAGARLRELEQLRAEGLVTDDEYRHKRAEILKDL
jgi:hypothetical protein